MKTLTKEELVDYAELEMIWDNQTDIALKANCQKEMQIIITTSPPGENEQRFLGLITKRKAFIAKNNINI